MQIPNTSISSNKWEYSILLYNKKAFSTTELVTGIVAQTTEIPSRSGCFSWTGKFAFLSGRWAPISPDQDRLKRNHSKLPHWNSYSNIIPTWIFLSQSLSWKKGCSLGHDAKPAILCPFLHWRNTCIVHSTLIYVCLLPSRYFNRFTTSYHSWILLILITSLKTKL